MQRAKPHAFRFRICAAAFLAAIATVFVVPATGAPTPGSGSVAYHSCPPVC